MDITKMQSYEAELEIVLELLEQWGNNSRFIWFRELDRLTGIDRGLLRNILNELKKTKELKEIHGQNKRIFFALTKYYDQCHKSESKFKGKNAIISDEHGKSRGQSRTQKSMDRTRKRIEKQQKRREVKLFSRAKHQRKINS